MIGIVALVALVSACFGVLIQVLMHPYVLAEPTLLLTSDALLGVALAVTVGLAGLAIAQSNTEQ